MCDGAIKLSRRFHHLSLLVARPGQLLECTTTTTATTNRLVHLLWTVQHSSIPGSGGASVLSTVETAWRLPGCAAGMRWPVHEYDQLLLIKQYKTSVDTVLLIMYKERHVSTLSAIFRLHTQLRCADTLLIKLCLDFFYIVLLILY